MHKDFVSVLCVTGSYMMQHKQQDKHQVMWCVIGDEQGRQSHHRVLPSRPADGPDRTGPAKGTRKAARAWPETGRCRASMCKPPGRSG